jgi:CRP-like cAMP-binding protein
MRPLKQIPVRSAQDDLRALDLFSETSRSEMALVARQLTMLRVPAGKVLVREGERGNEFMIIAEGRAEVRQGDRIIATIGRGDLVGEMALLQRDGDGRRNATVTTVTDAVIYVGSPREFRQIIQSAPSVAEKVQQTAASRLPAAA